MTVSPELREMVPRSRDQVSPVLGPVRKVLATNPTTRVDKWVHPSEVSNTSWCPRRDYYRIADYIPDIKAVPFSLRREAVFAEGKEIHLKWQGWLREAGILEGRWECRLCGSEVWAVAADLHPCAVCTAHSRLPVPLRMWEYREVPVEDPVLRIHGHADGKVGNNLLEIKSIGEGTLRWYIPQEVISQHTTLTAYGTQVTDWNRLWANLSSPFAAHIRQVMIYAYLARACANLKIDGVVFIYEYKSTQDAKEFYLPYDEETVQPMIDQIQDLNEWLRTGITPPRPGWAQADHFECKRCPFLGVCYADID